MSAELFVEVRCEELPAAWVRPALDALKTGILGLLDGIEVGVSQVYATPRRLAVVVHGVAPERPSTEKIVTGPPADRAFDDGKPTPAAVGFAKGRGVRVEELLVVDGPKGKVVAAKVVEPGERTLDRVSKGLDGVVRSIPFEKPMEWGTGGVRFGRPLQSIMALYGGTVVPGEVAGLRIGRHTEGHRLASDRSFAVEGSASWLGGLRARQVEPDLAVRAQRIRALLEEATTRLGADPIGDAALEEQVLHLVEWPVLVLSTFDEELLELPPRLLVEAMKVHQRYFPVYRQGRLTHHFVVIANNPWCDPETVAVGNARVLRPRFYDARYFYAEDRRKPLADHGAGLDKMAWIRGLGTMAQKQRRVAALAEQIAPIVGADPALAKSAGALCKSDLLAKMVREFPELQGHVGKLLAQNDGLQDAVGAAIEEHYLPRFADDETPHTPAGRATSLADRLDTLVGCFGIGLKPKSGDPQGLRRAALGVTRILIDGRIVTARLDALFAAAWAHYEGQEPKLTGAREAVVAELVEFTRTRLRAYLTGSGTSADLVDAALADPHASPVVLYARCKALAGAVGRPEFLPILHTFKRVLNITRGETAPRPNASDCRHPAERALLQALSATEGGVLAAAEALDYAAALDQALTLARPVADFFDAVLVDSPDPDEKRVRMGILIAVSHLFLEIADFTRISTR